MAEPERPSLEELARRLRECAERLRASAQKLKLAAGAQKEHVDKLNELNERIKKTLAALSKTQPPPVKDDTPANPVKPISTFNFIDMTQYLAQKRNAPGEKFPRDMTYVEALEFADYNEFLRFQNQPAINDEDLSKCDLDELFLLLIADNPS